MGHYYRVELTRRVSSPAYGSEAYQLDVRLKEFTFGKGKEFKTGKLALVAANEFAKSMMEKSSCVSIWRMNGTCGTGEYLKEDHDSRFDIGWTSFD